MHSQDSARQARAQQLLKHEPISLTDKDRVLVEATIKEVGVYRSWAIRALNCRSNHVHVVVTARDVPPERVMNQSLTFEVQPVVFPL